ncbi:hypothetical protein BDF19DRAFT_495122, partial [Syncephalis fuscata]
MLSKRIIFAAALLAAATNSVLSVSGAPPTNQDTSTNQSKDIDVSFLGWHFKTNSVPDNQQGNSDDNVTFWTIEGPNGKKISGELHNTPKSNKDLDNNDGSTDENAKTIQTNKH